MKPESKRRLDLAASYLAKGEGFYHAAANEIIDTLEDDPSLTYREIATHFGKSKNWVAELVKWHKDGAEGPINWSRGSHGTKKELEAGIDKFIEEATPEELLNRLGAGKVAEIVGSSENVATVIIRNDDARNRIAMANLRETMRSSGGSGGGNTKNPIAPKLPPVPLPIKLGYIATKVRDVATEMALTYKDDAPLASEDVLEQANHVMTQAVRDFEEIIESALDGTFNIRRATDASS